MKVTTYDQWSDGRPALLHRVDAECQCFASHVNYNPAMAPSVVELNFTPNGRDNMVWVQMSPEEAEDLARRLIVQAWKARGNI